MPARPWRNIVWSSASSTLIGASALRSSPTSPAPLPLACRKDSLPPAPPGAGRARSFGVAGHAPSVLPRTRTLFTESRRRLILRTSLRGSAWKFLRGGSHHALAQERCPFWRSLPSSLRRCAKRSSYPTALGLVLLPGRSRHASRTGASSCSLSLSSWPTSTRARSIGAPERRSSAYSLTNLAESGCPASMRTASSSLAGAATLSEAWILGLYQYICVLLPNRTLTSMYPMLRSRNGRGGSSLSLRNPYSPECV